MRRQFLIHIEAEYFAAVLRQPKERDRPPTAEVQDAHSRPEITVGQPAGILPEFIPADTAEPHAQGSVDRIRHAFPPELAAKLIKRLCVRKKFGTFEIGETNRLVNVGWIPPR